MKELIRRLSEIDGPPGREHAVREAVRRELAGRVDSLTVSPLGSLHAVLNPGGGPKVMLAAHLDEAGVIVAHVDERGFARFQVLGPVPPEACLGQRVRFARGTIGVIAAEARSPHKGPIALESLYLDFGCTSRRECPVGVGDIGAFHTSFLDLGGRVAGKAIDDRVGVAVLMEAVRRLRRPANEIQLAFTVQEQVGRRGARASAFTLDPQVGLAVDLTPASDGPRDTTATVRLGAGPAVSGPDAQLLADPRLVELILRRARAARLACQVAVDPEGTTDASAVARARAGVPSAAILIPSRHLHTPAAMVDLADAENAVRLLVRLLERPLELG